MKMSKIRTLYFDATGMYSSDSDIMNWYIHKQ